MTRPRERERDTYIHTYTYIHTLCAVKIGCARAYTVRLQRMVQAHLTANNLVTKYSPANDFSSACFDLYSPANDFSSACFDLKAGINLLGQLVEFDFSEL
jgi:hypothetical protein